MGEEFLTRTSRPRLSVGDERPESPMPRPRLTYANVMATVAVVLALGGGAYAAIRLPAKSVGARQLRRHAVTPSKVAKSTVHLFKGRKGARGPRGVQGPKGNRGTKGDKGQPGTARAYGLVSPTGALTKAKNATVTHPGTGLYCIALGGGINPATTDVALTMNFTTDDTAVSGSSDPQAFAERGGPTTCPSTTLQVRTFAQYPSVSANHFTNEGFFFLVP
jgi:hypothetical protein